MSSYDADFPFALAITIDNSSASGTADVEIVVPDIDHFWENTESDGSDVHVTAADGETLLSYDLNGWNQSTRTCTIRIDGMTLAASAGMYQAMVWYGNDTAVDAQSAVTIAAALTGYIERGLPGPDRARVRPEQPGASKPRERVSKTSDEEKYIWLDLSDLLSRAERRNNCTFRHEEVFSVAVQVTRQGVAQSSMVTGANQRFVRTLDGRTWCRVYVSGGVDGENYAIEALVKTHVPDETAHSLYQPRVLLQVRDVAEA